MNPNKFRNALVAAVVAAMAAACSQGQVAGEASGATTMQAPDRASLLADAVRTRRAANAQGSSVAGGMLGFASLPDRGDLVAYPKQRVVRHVGPYTWHRADISEAHALNAMVDGTLELTTPSGEQLRFQYDRHVEHDSGDWTWIGHLVGGGLAQDAILTFGTGAVFGSISQPGQASLKLAMEDGVSWLVETDLIERAAQAEASGRYRHPDFLLPPDLRVTDGLRAQGATVRSAAAFPAGRKTIDLLVGYTSGFATAQMGRAGIEANIITRLNHLVDLTNESYVNSEVNAEVRLVHTLQVTYPDASANSTALHDVTGSDGSNETPIDPALEVLHAARDQYGADLVTLVRDFQHPEAVNCGVAWLLGGGQSLLYPEYEPFGMSVVSDGEDGAYSCEETTLAHELGHNMGLAHDVETAKGEDGVLDQEDYGRYAYSFGYKTGPGTGDFYTVMAYGDSGQVGFRVFSNPDVSICGGFRCGVEGQSDNARTLRDTTQVISAFRAQVVPDETFARVDRDANADGRADVLWFNDTAGRFQAWYMNGASWSYGQAFDLDTTKYVVAGSGDFNGDSRVDVLWVDRARTELWVWQARADNTYDIVFLRGYPAGWNIEGVADFNGDGRDDVFWYNASLGLTQAWHMNGSSWTYGSVNGISPNAYSVAGVGDTNGDGLADVVWHDNAKTQLWTWLGQAEGSFAIHFLRGYPAGWAVVGLGDANADGRKDIFWHNPAAGLLQSWLMNGATWTYGQPFAIPSQYKVAAIDDFDGNGRADIIWHDDAQAWMWLSDQTGGYAIHYLRTYPAGWGVVNTP